MQSLRPARKRAMFFCGVWIFIASMGLFITVSCAHTSKQADEAVASPKVEANANLLEDIPTDSEGSPSPRKKPARQHIEELIAEMEQTKAENASLKRENDMMRSEITRLEAALADANQSIYSLERKLDAIFNPNGMNE